MNPIVGGGSRSFGKGFKTNVAKAAGLPTASKQTTTKMHKRSFVTDQTPPLWTQSRYEESKKKVAALIAKTARETQRNFQPLATPTDFIKDKNFRSIKPIEEMPNVTKMLTYRSELRESFSNHSDTALSPMEAILQKDRRAFSFMNSTAGPIEAEKTVQNILKSDPGEAIRHAESENSPILQVDGLTLETIKKVNEAIVKRNHDFYQALEHCLNGHDTVKSKIEALEYLIYHECTAGDGKSSGLDRFNCHEQTEIFKTFWNLEAYDHMVEMMEQSRNPSFKSNLLNLEFYVRANLKGNYFNPHNALAIAELISKSDPDSVEVNGMKGVIFSVMKESARQVMVMLGKKHYSPQIDELYRKCFPIPTTADRFEEAKNNYLESLVRADCFYKKAFAKDFDPRYGLRVLHLELERKDPTEAKQAAKLIQMACLKEGRYEMNLSLARAMLESAYVLGDVNSDQVLQLEQAVLKLAKTHKSLQNVHGSLKRLIRLLPKATPIASFNKIIEERLLEVKRTGQISLSSEEFSDLHFSTKNKQTRQLETLTYDYRGKTSNYVEGNFKFGAQLPAQNINRQDRKFFEELTEIPLRDLLPDGSLYADRFQTIQDIKEITDFVNVSNEIIRSRFKTDEWDLERLTSAGHHKFDAIVAGLIQLSGVPGKEARKILKDSRTNISLEFTSGIGDCRHHSHVKQLLFDTWQRKRTNAALARAFEAGSAGDLKIFQECEIEFKEIYSYAMKIMDCEVYLPVKLDQNHVPEFHESGLMVKNPKGQLVKAEGHTFNVLFKYSQDQNVVEAWYSDAFYHNTYSWKDGSIPFQERDLKKDGFSGKTVMLVDPSTGREEPAEVLLRPSRYAGAGNQAVYDQGSNTNRFIGLPVNGFTAEQSVKIRSDIAGFLDSVYLWTQRPNEFSYQPPM